MTMPHSDVLRSSHNPLIKRFRSLGSRKHRDAERAFVVEGSRGIATALELGITPHAYLIQSRARLARAMLASGLPIADAAAEAGFADQSHLTRAFARQFGITPGRSTQAV